MRCGRLRGPHWSLVWHFIWGPPLTPRWKAPVDMMSVSFGCSFRSYIGAIPNWKGVFVVPAANLSFGFCHSAWEKRLASQSNHHPPTTHTHTHTPLQNDHRGELKSHGLRKKKKKKDMRKVFVPLIDSLSEEADGSLKKKKKTYTD